MLSLAAHRAQIPRDTLFFKLEDHYFTIWCWFCNTSAWIGRVCHIPPSRTSLPSGLYRALCELAESQGTFPRGLFYTCWCAHFHGTLSIRPTLCFPSVSTSLLFMRHKRSESLGSVESMWPRAQRRLQGIRKETDSSTALECGFPPSQPPSGRLSISHDRPARLPGNKPLGASCLLRAPGSLGTVSSQSCRHLQALVGIDWSQSSHSVGKQMLL